MTASSICVDCGEWRPVPALRLVSALCPPCRDTRAEKARAGERRRERERERAAARTHNRPEHTR